MILHFLVDLWCPVSGILVSNDAVPGALIVPRLISERQAQSILALPSTPMDIEYSAIG